MYFIIYTDKNIILGKEFEDFSIFQSPSQMVMILMRPLLNKGYCLMMNNFYNSHGLADLLIKNKTDDYGTLRVSRKKIFRELESRKLKIGETIAFQRRKVCVMKWKNKKNISHWSINDEYKDPQRNNKKNRNLWIITIC